MSMAEQTSPLVANGNRHPLGTSTHTRLADPHGTGSR